MAEVTFGASTLKIDGVDPNHITELRRAAPLAEFRRTNNGGYWTVPYADAGKVIGWADQHEANVDPRVRSYADSLWLSELNAACLATATDASVCDDPTVVGLVSTLLPCQKIVVHASTKAWTTNPAHPDKVHRALLVADEPGLGKTIMALAALRTQGNERQRAVIICPTSLTVNWHSEMLQHFEDQTFHPWVAQTLTPSPVPHEVDVVIIGWDILTAWVDELVQWQPDAVIADEGHYAKSGKKRTKKETTVARDQDGNAVRDEHGNLQVAQHNKVLSGSARASAVLSIGTATAKHHGLVLALTGTPIVNRPLELPPLLEFEGILRLFGGSTAFKNRFCGPTVKNIGRGRTRTDYSGASNLMELNTRLTTSGHYVRRTKEALVEAGDLQRKYVDHVYVYDYNGQPRPWVITPTEEEFAAYTAVRDETAEFFHTRAAEIAQELGSSVNTAAVRRKVAGEGNRHLKKIGELRKAAAEVKVPYVTEKVRELVASGEKVVIAAHHRDIVNDYAEAFSGLKIQGDMGVAGIEQAKHLFNATPVTEHPVLVLSVEAGKTGHTLCKQALHEAGPACAYMVFAEQVWTPGDEAQAQDRIWRIGQDRQVRIANALLRDSIDMSIYWSRTKKRAVVNAAIDAVDPDVLRSNDEREGAGQIAQQLVYGQKQETP